MTAVLPNIESILNLFNIIDKIIHNEVIIKMISMILFNMIVYSLFLILHSRRPK